jgi:hypothetical protein
MTIKSEDKQQKLTPRTLNKVSSISPHKPKEMAHRDYLSEANLNSIKQVQQNKSRGIVSLN